MAVLNKEMYRYRGCNPSYTARWLGTGILQCSISLTAPLGKCRRNNILKRSYKCWWAHNTCFDSWTLFYRHWQCLDECWWGKVSWPKCAERNVNFDSSSFLTTFSCTGILLSIRKSTTSNTLYLWKRSSSNLSQILNVRIVICVKLGT